MVPPQETVRKQARSPPHRLRSARRRLPSGIVDTHPPFQEWRGAVADGLLRTAPSVTLRIAVVGPLDQAAAKALFLRGYSRDVTLLATRLNRDNLKPGLAEAGVHLVKASDLSLRRVGHKLEAIYEGRTVEFDVIYPAMGAEVRSQLALSLGAAHTEQDYLEVDDHQRTSVAGLYTPDLPIAVVSSTE
ncbi:hypothetical protein [Bradyrhizobium sp. S3.5.5]|uniref:hypothetical protein n=1 Tax=Bradyrhizobium sp. S3.5.5 TaxID=3156430 RepID=UPI00339592A2